MQELRTLVTRLYPLPTSAANWQAFEELLLNCCLNSKAHLIEGGGAGGSVGFVGNRTECALLMLARKWGANYKAVRSGTRPQYRVASG